MENYGIDNQDPFINIYIWIWIWSNNPQMSQLPDAGADLLWWGNTRMGGGCANLPRGWQIADS